MGSALALHALSAGVLGVCGSVVAGQPNDPGNGDEGEIRDDVDHRQQALCKPEEGRQEFAPL